MAVPTPLRSTFQYRLTKGQSAPPGAQVIVPFGKRKLVGVVTSNDRMAKLPEHKIRDVIKVLSNELHLTKPLLKLCEWAADYYHHPIGEVIASALPTLIRKGVHPRAPVECLLITSKGNEVELAAMRRSPAQRKLLLLLKSDSPTKDDLKIQNISNQTIKTLILNGWATWRSKSPSTPPFFQLNSVNHEGISLNKEQEKAIASVKKKAAYLLHGVTGSGKTEVYFRLIEPVLKSRKQVLFLVPEIGLTPQTISRFRTRFNVKMAVLHSSLSDQERAAGWLRAMEGGAGIILGTRSAIFTPIAKMGLIIVDEEHDSSYKQQDGFRYSARDLAVLRGNFEACSVILGSATPSLESLRNVESRKYKLLSLTKRAAGAQQEKYELIDKSHLESNEGFTKPLKEQIANQLGLGHQVLVFLNRRGFAPVMMCSTCRWIAQCPRCDARLTYHLKQNSLICHHCGTIHRDVANCQSCGGQHVSAIGLGTQRIEQYLKATFPNTPILRIDRDSTRRQDAMGSFVAEVGKGLPAILVGTQLLAKGHHFPNVTLVAMLDVDASFYSSDYRALERLGQLVLQVGGRAGRADQHGTVMIQTDFAYHPLLRKLIDEGYSAFASELLDERLELLLPPYRFHALIRAEAKDHGLARDFLENVVRQVKPKKTFNLLGPIPALMEKKAGRFRQLAILTSEARLILHQELGEMIKLADQSELSRKVRWSVDVDPVDLF